MFFHGELAATKPAPRYLTTFYLMVSLGVRSAVRWSGLLHRVLQHLLQFGIGLVITLLRRRISPLIPLDTPPLWHRRSPRIRAGALI
jgi:hypothetical protein